MQSHDPEQFYRYPGWRVLQGRLLDLLVNQLGHHLLDALAVLSDPLDPAAVEQTVKAWLGVRSNGQGVVLPEIWSCRVALDKQTDKGPGEDEEDEPGEPHFDKEADFKQRSPSLPSFKVWPGWSAALTILSEPSALAKHLIGSRDKQTHRYSIEEMRIAWRNPQKQDEARRILSVQFSRYCYQMRIRLAPESDREEKNREKIQKAIRRLYGRKPPS